MIGIIDTSGNAVTGTELCPIHNTSVERKEVWESVSMLGIPLSSWDEASDNTQCIVKNCKFTHLFAKKRVCNLSIPTFNFYRS